MAIPTQPSLDSITVEALKKCGYPSATAGDTLQTRAEDWVEESKQDIAYLDTKLKPLMVTTYGVTAEGVSRYANPADFGSDLSITILDGNDTGTCQSGASGSATLAADESLTSPLGKLLLITGNTGEGSCSQISAWDSSTKVATVTPNFTTAPDNTSTYLVVNHHYPLTQTRIEFRDAIARPHRSHIPTNFYPIGQGNADDDETGEFEFYPTPNDTYGIQLRYYANILLVDITSNLMKTLYRRWRHIFNQAVIYKCRQNDRNPEWKDEFKIYKSMLQELRVKEGYGLNFHNLQGSITA